MRPHYPITHREARNVPLNTVLFILVSLVGVALALGAIALAHCRP